MEDLVVCQLFLDEILYYVEKYGFSGTICLGEIEDDRDCFKKLTGKDVFPILFLEKIRIKGMNPRASSGPYIPPQGAGYYTLRLWRDCSTNKFQFTLFLKFESHNRKEVLIEHGKKENFLFPS